MAKIKNSKQILAAIKRERLISGLTQQQVADKIGITRISYSNIERGVFDVTIQRLEKITSAIGVELHCYLERRSE